MHKTLMTNYENSKCRNKRLQQCFDIYCNSRPVNIERMHDHKGELTVTWKTLPSEEEKNLIKKAWEQLDEYYIRHIIFVEAEVCKKILIEQEL